MYSTYKFVLIKNFLWWFISSKKNSPQEVEPTSPPHLQLHFPWQLRENTSLQRILVAQMPKFCCMLCKSPPAIHNCVLIRHRHCRRPPPPPHHHHHHLVVPRGLAAIRICITRRDEVPSASLMSCLDTKLLSVMKQSFIISNHDNLTMFHEEVQIISPNDLPSNGESEMIASFLFLDCGGRGWGLACSVRFSITSKNHKTTQPGQSSYPTWT